MSITLERFILFALIPISTVAYQDTQPLINGGEYAVINEYPHLAVLAGQCGSSEQWLCGASILNQRILLSAAHCFYGCKLWRPKTHRLAAFFGSTMISEMEIQRRISKLASHKEWKEMTGENDIALVFVRKDIPLGMNVKRAIIPRKFPHVSRFFEAFVAGWGENKYPDPLKGHLRKTYQKLRSPKTCSRYGKIYVGMFCAGRMRDDDYPSSGDSGSPLVTGNQYHIIGLVSFGWILYPAMTIYTNVTYYQSWIAYNAKKLYCESKDNLRRQQTRLRLNNSYSEF